MAASRSIFRVLTETQESVEEVMNRGNRRLHQDVKKGMFVALLYAVLDPKEKMLTFSMPDRFNLSFVLLKNRRLNISIAKEIDSLLELLKTVIIKKPMSHLNKETF